MTSLPNEIERGGDYLYRGVKYTRTDLIPAMIREAVQHEFAELMDAVRSIADDNNRIEMDVFDACEAIIRARKGGE